MGLVALALPSVGHFVPYFLHLIHKATLLARRNWKIFSCKKVETLLGDIALNVMMHHYANFGYIINSATNMAMPSSFGLKVTKVRT
jgi:hypothetical protein